MRMSAFTRSRYGSPGVLVLSQVDRPVPAAGELLVAVAAASVNPFDWHHMRGAPLPMRLGSGLLRPKQPILGVDVAGRVVEVGADVSRFAPGDEVYGFASFGAFAEFACVKESKLVARRAELSVAEAAAVPLGAITALQCMRDHGGIRKGQKVLINGAAGGVGTFAVQLARHFEAEVTGVCSAGKLDLVRSIGADHAIDYTREDFSRNGRRYDLILDAVGNCTASALRRSLSAGGIGVLAGFKSMPSLIRLLMLKRWAAAGNRGVTLMLTKANGEDLAFIDGLIDAGRISPVLDRRYAFSELPAAIAYLEEGHARGKVVVTMPAL